MNDQIQQQVIERIDALAAKMGVAADHFWPILVRQQIIEAYTNIVLLVFAAALSVVLAVVAKYQFDKDNEGIAFPLGAASGVVGFIVFVVLSSDGSSIVSAILNPEYAALMDVLRNVER